MLTVDLHVHSISSGHAANTIYELAEAARSKKMSVIAITDHGPSMLGAPHVGYFNMIDFLPKEIYGVRVCFGCETNIVDIEGNLDLPVDVLERLDVVIMGLHKLTPYDDLSGTIANNTKAMVNAIKKHHHCVNFISHPYRSIFPVEIESVVRIAADHNIGLEINNSLFAHYSREDEIKELLDNTCKMIELAEKLGCKLVVCSDAHVASDIGNNSDIPAVCTKLGMELDIIAKQFYALSIEST